MLVCIAVSVLLVAYAAMCNAKMDTVKDHYGVSIYSGKDIQWYNPMVSWSNKDNPSTAKKLQLEYLPIPIRWIAALKPGWDPLSDFWHWQKTQMLFSLLAATAVCLFSYSTSYSSPIDRAFISFTYLIIGGVVWILVFNYFYNHKLIK